MADARPSGQLPATSVVLLSRNRLAHTRRCLASLAATMGDLEWIVVDNGSTDGTREYLDGWRRRSSWPAKVVLNDHDPGGSRARNQGIAEAGGELVLFLDNDVYLEDPDWLVELVAPLQGDPRVVAASPLLLFPGPGDLIQCAGGGVTASGHFGLLWRGLPSGLEHRISRPAAWAPTAALLVRRDVLLAAGGFDESFDPVSLCEDLDLCCRLRTRGTIAFAGASRLRHYEGTTFGHLGYRKREYWKRHARVIRNRWSDVLTSGPLHTDDDIVWRPIVKTYDDLDAASVRVAAGREAAVADLSFFASVPTLGADPPDLRVGVIGCGQVAVRGALPGFAPPGSTLAATAAPFLAFDGAPGVRLTGVADVDQGRALAAAGLSGAQHVDTDAERLLDTVPLEGVAICTPPAWHVRYATAAMRRGISVLLEKPGSANLADFDALLQVRDARPDLACLVNLPWAYHPTVEAVADFARAGVLGRLRRVSAVLEHRGPEAWAREATWYRQPDVGVVRDLGLHVLVVVERLLGVPVDGLDVPANGVSASGDRAAASGLAGDAALALEVGWDAPRPRFSVCLAGDDATVAFDLIPWGPAAVQVWPAGRRAWAGPRLMTDPGGRVWLAVSGPPTAGGPYRQFTACIRSGATGLTDVSRIAGAMGQVLDWATRASR
jgi:predicted dehydrogenase/GT2 family glycosyltransferase